MDEGGNYILATAIINDSQKLIIVNVYGPNEDSPQFYEKMGSMCGEIGDEDTPVIIGGDFNIALNNALDTANYARRDTRCSYAIHELGACY